jgi:hypothetical protein
MRWKDCCTYLLRAGAVAGALGYGACGDGETAGGDTSALDAVDAVDTADTEDAAAPDTTTPDTTVGDVSPDTGEDRCPRGFTRCGEDCVDTGVDRAHCGECEVACGDAEHCRVGECTEGGVSFEIDLRPLFGVYGCDYCHSFMRPDRLVNVPMNDRACEGALRVAPGDPEASGLLTTLTGASCVNQMPPSGEPMSASQVDLVRRWIAEGALDN